MENSGTKFLSTIEKPWLSRNSPRARSSNQMSARRETSHVASKMIGGEEQTKAPQVDRNTARSLQPLIAIHAKRLLFKSSKVKSSRIVEVSLIYLWSKCCCGFACKLMQSPNLYNLFFFDIRFFFLWYLWPHYKFARYYKISNARNSKAREHF